MSYDADLLPAPDQSLRCAVHAEVLGVDPGGTALAVDEIVVVDLPLPWPKPVWAKPGYTAVPEWELDAAAAGRRVRVLAAIPGTDDHGGRIVVHRRHGAASFARTEHFVERESVVDVLEGVLRGPAGTDAPSPIAIDDAPRELLICTQGSHDVCCGSRGPALIAALSAARPDLEIRRVSHTGGHRFAPTGVSLPDGRMWGGLDVETVLAILDRSAPPSRVAGRCRGWTGAAEGPAQVAERAVLAHVDDWSFDDEARSVEIDETGDGCTTCTVLGSGRRWEVDVIGGRAVPTIACGKPGGLPAKPGGEWRVTGLRLV